MAIIHRCNLVMGEVLFQRICPREWCFYVAVVAHRWIALVRNSSIQSCLAQAVNLQLTEIRLHPRSMVPELGQLQRSGNDAVVVDPGAPHQPSGEFCQCDGANGSD